MALFEIASQSAGLCDAPLVSAYLYRKSLHLLRDMR